VTLHYKKGYTFRIGRENSHGKIKKKIKFKKSRLRYNPSKSRLSLFLVVVFLGFIIFSYGGHLNQLYAMEQELEKIQNQVEELHKKNTELREQLEKLQSREYVEHVAREKLGLIHEGEVLVVPVDPAHARQVPPPLNEKIRD